MWRKFRNSLCSWIFKESLNFTILRFQILSWKNAQFVVNNERYCLRLGCFPLDKSDTSQLIFLTKATKLTINWNATREEIWCNRHVPTTRNIHFILYAKHCWKENVKNGLFRYQLNIINYGVDWVSENQV